MSRSRPVLIAAAAAALLTLTRCGDNSGPVTGPDDSGITGRAVTGTGSLSEPTILVGAGDISSCSNNGDGTTALLLDNIAGTVYTLGDNVYNNGTTSEFANCYEPTWGRHKARTRPSAGNKDYNTTGAAPYYAYFGASAGDPTQGYYSYPAGDWHVIVLNSNISRGPTSPQIQWLRADLAANPTQCTLAYWHHPLYSSTTGSGSGGSTISGNRTFWDTLYAAGADLVLGGHRHFYDRIAPMKPDGSADPETGIREIVVGSGGVGGGTPSNVFPLSEVRNGDTRGVLKLYLYPDSYAWKFVPVAGKTFTDSGSTACHGPPGSGGPAVSPTLSTVEASPTSIGAGSGTSTITVTARDADGNPLSGKTVFLSATGSGNTLTQPTGPTDANGVATGSLSSTGAGSKTISATIGGIAVIQTAAVTVTAGAISATQSTVSANPGTISVETGSSTITVTVRDQHGNPVSGSTVVLAATGDGNTLTQPGPTNPSGVATGALSSAVAEGKTVSATADGTPISQTAAVSVVPAGGASITHTLLTSGNDLVNKEIYTTASISPAPNTLVTLAVLGHRSSAAPAAPTVTGGGMSSWVQVASVAFETVAAPLKRLTIFRAMSSSPGSGPITITFPANVSNSQWIVSQWEGVDLSGVNGAGAIVQTTSSSADAVSGLTATLAPFGSVNNVAYGVVGLNAPALAVTPASGFTEIDEILSGESPRGVLEAEWAPTDNSLDPSWSGSFRAGLLAIELKAAGAP